MVPFETYVYKFHSKQPTLFPDKNNVPQEVQTTYVLVLSVIIRENATIKWYYYYPDRVMLNCNEQQYQGVLIFDIINPKLRADPNIHKDVNVSRSIT